MWYYFNIIPSAAFNGNTRMLSYFTVIVLLTAASIIDFKEHRIPDNLIAVGAVIGLGFSLLDPYMGFLNSFIGGITAGLVLLLIFYITKGGLGLGDVKLFGCTGIYLGLSSIASAMLIAAVLSGLFSLVLICINRNNKKREIPFAPFILAGALAAIVF